MFLLSQGKGASNEYSWLLNAFAYIDGKVSPSIPW